MKRLLILTLITFVAVLQSCDERITPAQTKLVEVKPPTKTEILTANVWQYNEFTIKGGSATKVVFSKIANPPIQLSSDYGKTSIIYKSDGSFEKNVSGSIEKRTWKFLNNETQIETTSADGKLKILYNVDLLTKDNLNLTNIATKVAYNDDAFWIGFVTNLGFSNTITEFSNIEKLIPLK
ncbi:MAG: hypothetical protein U5N85_10395 [Arcicella sp.]|nr:hypothetical protein [Arcicella sp.]